MRRAAQIFRERKYEMAAWLSLEAGKSRVEAMGEVEEAADLIDVYAAQMEEHDGYVITLGQLSPAEVNHSVLRPYGVWVVISPFNFPIALTTGMLAGALIAGNTAVFKPSEQTPLTGVKVFECLRDAGLPVGALNFVTGRGNDIGEALSSDPDVDGIVFTGSARVGTHVYREFSRERPRPCIAEMGGKNPVIVMDDADLDKAVEGTVRAAFGFSGQKCSAASRAYVHRAVADEFERRLVERALQLTVGDPAKADVFTGPVISQVAYERFQESCRRAQADGEILCGGTVIDDGESAHGFFCRPTIARLPTDHPFFYEELFVPLHRGRVVRFLRGSNRSRQRLTVRADRRNLFRERGHHQTLSGRDRGRGGIRQPKERSDHRRVARRAVFRWLENERLDREVCPRTVLRAAVHARANADGRVRLTHARAELPRSLALDSESS